MNRKTILLGATALVFGGLVISPKLAQAYRGDPNVQGPNHTTERHEIMIQAFDNNDYDAWKEKMQGKGRVTQIVNQDNFDRFAQAHKLAQEGKVDEAKAVRTELGLGQGQRKGNGNSSGRWNR